MSNLQAQATRPALLAAVIVIGLNLRPFLTSIGPLAKVIGRETGLGFQGTALLTLLPVLLMGALAFLGPYTQRRFGARRSILFALVVLCLGTALRSLADQGWLLLVTALLCGLGVAVVHAIFPGVIKRHFATRVTLVTGLYSSMLMAGGALGAQLTPWVSDAAQSWQLGLAWLAAPAALAVLMGAAFLPRDAARHRAGSDARSLLARPRTWALMACFGLVNGGYSSTVAWLAASYQMQGWGDAASGSLLAVMAASQAVAALLLPMLASRHPDRRPWLWLTLAMQLAGFAGLAISPTAAPLAWVALLGAGLGGCFALTMVLALDHLPDPGRAGTLSALMQGGGFLIAALPPWIVALLRDATGSFAGGWLMHATIVATVAILALRFRPGSYARAMREPSAGLQQPA